VEAEAVGGKAPAVVLLHGLWFAGWTLAVLAERLRRAGFSTHAFTYRSVTGDLAENAAAVDAFARRIDAPVVHFVGHSLGGVVIRALFERFPEQRAGRIVTLGSPHQGSYPGRVLGRHSFGRRILGRSVLDVVEGVPGTWTLPGREIGVVSGDVSFGIGRLVPGLPRPNDGVVTTDEAELAGATDAIRLHVVHTAMLFSPQVAFEVSHFLERGRFSDAADRAASASSRLAQ